MIGYKAFDENLKCMDFQYVIGETYTLEGDLSICNCGFHFCKVITDVYNYYPRNDKTRICKIEALGKIVSKGAKSCTDKIKILEEITNNSIKKGNLNDTSTGFCNTGNYNFGDYNAGDNNSGNSNTGSYNSGNCNVGNYNYGNYNFGNHNSGNYNTGNYNSGNCNTEYFNSGYSNTGCYNSGNRNTGDGNTGNFNSGYYNSGDRNTGSFNTGNFNTGFFNTTDSTIRLFNKDSNMTISEFCQSKAYCIIMHLFKYSEGSEWVDEYEMTKEEKEKHPEHKTIKGYLKSINQTNDSRQSMWNNLSEEYKNEVMSLPNFDKEIFKQCTGIDVDYNNNHRD